MKIDWNIILLHLIASSEAGIKLIELADDVDLAQRSILGQPTSPDIS